MVIKISNDDISIIVNNSNCPEIRENNCGFASKGTIGLIINVEKVDTKILKGEKHCDVIFINEIRDQNPEKNILIILDNFRSHHSKFVAETAELLDIRLVFIPPYSPDLNPIEFIWKSVKRIVSTASINSEENLKDRIRDDFLELSTSRTFAKNWKRKS